ELLSNLREQYPGQICAKPLKLEVVTTDTMTPASSTGEIFFLNNPTQGFVCKNSDQKDGRCKDYQVRFGCPSFCGPEMCWTEWYSRDRPTRTGDWELLRELRKQYPGQICAKPLKLEVVTTDTMTPASIYNSRGFVCRNSDQEDGICHNYQVRFRCPCNP
uniref:WxxW domain-containing protein n=1 Tax=Salarias fasciatus TaxID=181472 RepID=A0A672IK13_SALFA